MYRYTQVGSEFLLLQVIKKKNTPLISQLVRESIRTSFQTNAVFLVDIWILNPVFHACVKDPLHARTVAIRDFRVGNEIKLSNTLFRTPSSFCSLLFTTFPSFPAQSIVISLHPWRVRAQDHRSRGLPLRPVSATRSSPSTQQSHGSSSTARLTDLTVTSQCIVVASPA